MKARLNLQAFKSKTRLYKECLGCKKSFIKIITVYPPEDQVPWDKYPWSGTDFEPGEKAIFKKGAKQGWCPKCSKVLVETVTQEAEDLRRKIVKALLPNQMVQVSALRLAIKKESPISKNHLYFINCRTCETTYDTFSGEKAIRYVIIHAGHTTKVFLMREDKIFQPGHAAQTVPSIGPKATPQDYTTNFQATGFALNSKATKTSSHNNYVAYCVKCQRHLPESGSIDIVQKARLEHESKFHVGAVRVSPA